MRKRAISVMTVIGMLFSMSGCGETEVNQDMNSVQEATEVAVETEAENVFEDNDLLYADDDDTSVVTMYLTVSQGNESENTNHTWEEINTYSVYDYDAMGVERYAVNGLLQVGDENGPLEGELGYGTVVPNAIVTIRGQSSSRGTQKNYKIKVKDGKGKWNEQSIINLNKHQAEGLRFRNKLCYDLLEELPGMMALQTQFVHLYVKDETVAGNGDFVDYGLYTQVEQPNKRFLERHGLDKNGHLYKINFFEFYRYEDVIMLKSDADYNEKAFEELIEIKGSDDHAKLIAMLEELNDYSVPIEEILEKWFDTENLASWMAFQILTGNIDTQSRNTMIYSALNSNKWYFISWDCDASFKITEDQIRGSAYRAGWEHGISNYWGNVLLQRALKSESFLSLLDAKIEEFRGILTEEKISGMVDAYATAVKPYVFGETDRFGLPLTEMQYEEVCRSLPQEIEENYKLYKESLEEPMPFYIDVPMAEESKISFTWGNSYDFDDENVYYTFELSDDLSFQSPIVKEENLFVSEYVYDKKIKPGQYFMRVTAVNESGKEMCAFDNYISDGNVKNSGVRCFYVLEDGSIEVDTYEE